MSTRGLRTGQTCSAFFPLLPLIRVLLHTQKIVLFLTAHLRPYTITEHRDHQVIRDTITSTSQPDIGGQCGEENGEGRTISPCVSLEEEKCKRARDCSHCTMHFSVSTGLLHKDIFLPLTDCQQHSLTTNFIMLHTGQPLLFDISTSTNNIFGCKEAYSILLSIILQPSCPCVSPRLQRGFKILKQSLTVCEIF